ncbi:MAG: hypothetical protein K2Y37_09445 [Pirellulales bacterium]|nr:hypothetical protein [Pirellulales bacterium]
MMHKVPRIASVLLVVSSVEMFAMRFDAMAADPQASSAAVYQPAGAPADPKVPAQWNRYHLHGEISEFLQKLAAAHPERCRLQDLGKSFGGREMWLLTIGNFSRGELADKPAFWIDGGIHANEIQSVEVVLYTAWYLLESYGRNPLVTRLVDERAFFLLPMLSPDSRDAHMQKANTTHSPRSGQRPVDDDRDGLVDEDGPDDLDGDGSITQMRVHDPNGRLVPHAKYPNLMIDAPADEPGQYASLGQEGFDNDGDGRVNEDADGYYDPNRDWPWNWQPAYVQPGASRYPLSILENRLVGDFVMAHPQIAGAQSYHNAGGMILRGPGAKDDRYDPRDIEVLDVIGKRGAEMLPGYRYINIANDLYEVYGGEVDWFYDMQGVFTFTNELFTGFNFFRKASEGYFGSNEDLHAFDRYLLFGGGIIPWREIDHPQFGKVEVGGFAKNWVRQPPSFLLEEECHRNMAFTLYHADQMPQVEVQSIDVTPLPGGLTQVTAVIANRKVIPTHAAADVRHRITPPDRISIEGPAIEVVLGLKSTDRFFREPEEQKRRPQTLEFSSIGGMQAVYGRWVVRGSGPYTVTVVSPKGGRATRTSDAPQ